MGGLQGAAWGDVVVLLDDDAPVMTDLGPDPVPLPTGATVLPVSADIPGQG